MQVTFALKNWKVKQDKETKLPTLCGTFALVIGEKELASQEFNDGYNCKTIPFSGDLIQELQKLEDKIKAEMERLLT